MEEDIGPLRAGPFFFAWAVLTASGDAPPSGGPGNQEKKN